MSYETNELWFSLNYGCVNEAFKRAEKMHDHNTEQFAGNALAYGQDQECLGTKLAEFRVPNRTYVFGSLFSATLITLAGAFLFGCWDGRILAFAWAGTFTVIFGLAKRLIPTARDTVRHFELGIGLVQHNQESSIRFEELQSVAIKHEHNYEQKAYKGSTAFFKLVSISGTMFEFGLEYKVHSSREAEIQSLCNRASHVIAMRMLKELRSTGSVSWTDQLTLTDSELQLRASLDDSAIAVPLNQSGAYQIHKGWFELSSEASFRAKAEEQNFYPGLLLFQLLSVAAAAAVEEEHYADRHQFAAVGDFASYSN